MRLAASRTHLRPVVPVALVAGSLALLSAAVVAGHHTRSTALLVMLVSVAVVGPTRIRWSRLLAALILIILFIPIRRYSLPGSLPFQLEPYRIFVALLVVAWLGALLVDPRARFRRTGFEGPLILIFLSVIGSMLINSSRVAAVSSEVDKKLMFFVSYILVVYLMVGTIRGLEAIDYLVKTLVVGGSIVGFFSIIEARTGYNIFNHLARAIPILRPSDPTAMDSFTRVGTAKLRVFGSAQHPVALSAALVVLMPLAFYLARRYRRRRWTICALILGAGCASTVSRTGMVMFLVVAIVFLTLRFRETRRMWPALIPALIAIHFALPGTLGALKESFFPAGGLVAQQQSLAGQSGSGRLADLSPGLTVWKEEPLFGLGYGTPVATDLGGPDAGSNALDDQWLGTLLEIGAAGFVGWLWLFCRAMKKFGGEAKRDRSERGWLLASLAAGIAAYGVGMTTYDAFAFIQVTFLLFIFIAIGSALMAEPRGSSAEGEEHAAREVEPTSRAVRRAYGT
ncbi:MAG TPA: O-antigen ligase family protein [Gaiellaceae bacterium]